MYDTGPAAAERTTARLGWANARDHNSIRNHIEEKRCDAFYRSH
jgi:hypothetical protein